MKVNTSDYISKAEGIHSSELSYEAKIEQLTNRKNDLESSIQRAQYRLESLYSRLAALECSDDDEEDNSAEISAIMAEISETNFELQEYATEQREVQYEISDASQSLREVQSKKRQMLGEIETLTATTSKNASALNALGGDYANVINRATSGLQNNMSNLAHAAQILGGNVSNTISGGAGSYHRYSSGAKSYNASQPQSTTGQNHSEKKSVFGGMRGTSDNSQYQQSSNSNFYQDAESQRDAMYAKKRHSGGMGTKGKNTTSSITDTSDLQSEASVMENRPTKKTGGFGKKASEFREWLKVDPSTLTPPTPNGKTIDHGPRDPREREYRKKQGSMGVRGKNSVPMEALATYMNSKNYGRDDFGKYSKDPVWRCLHRAAYPDRDLPPISRAEAMTLLQQYMYSHNYGKEDFSTYSRDPVWQELQRYVSPDGMLPFTRPKITSASNQYSRLVSSVTNNNIEYRTITPYGRRRSTEEIVARLSGGDKTNGSCSSLAFAYAGNKAGYDILDYRGGKSCDFFSSNDSIVKIANIPGIESEILYGKDDIACANNLLSQMIPEKEYYLAVGQHASIVRMRGGHYEYLELQSGNPTKNRWTLLNNQVLHNRFGCESNNLYDYPNILISVDSLSRNQEFIDLLGYLNTAETGQQKGVTGHVK